MTTKFKGTRTGTIKDATDSGRRAHWVPKSDLTLITSSDLTLNGPKSLPIALGREDVILHRKIAANPNASQAKSDLFSSQVPRVKSAGRLMIGFNVGQKPYWRAGQVYLLAYLEREEQLSDNHAMPAFSFYVGLGAFPGNEVVASERSAQLVFMNFGQPSKKFFSDMIDLSQTLAEDMNQESILLELQEAGQVVYLDYIEPKKKDWEDLDEIKDWLTENKNWVEPSVWRMK